MYVCMFVSQNVLCVETICMLHEAQFKQILNNVLGLDMYT